MNCNNCNFINPGGARFCAKCGNDMIANSLYAGVVDQNQIYSSRQSAWIYFRAICFVMALQFLVAIVIGTMAVLNGDSGNGILDNMVVTLFVMLLMQMCFFVSVLSGGVEPLKKIKYRLHLNVKLLLVSFAMWAVAFVAFLSTNVYFGAFLDSIGYKSSSLEMNTPLEAVLGLFVIGIVAPITEELVFRFGILEGFRQKGYLKAVLLSGLAFALMHMNPEQTFYQFLLGVVCAMAAFKSNSIVPAILIHAFNNLFSFVVGQWAWFNESLEHLFNQTWFVLVAILLFVAGVFVTLKLANLCQKFGNPKPNVSSVEKSLSNQSTSSCGTMLYCTTLGICVLFWILTFAIAMSGK